MRTCRKRRFLSYSGLRNAFTLGLALALCPSVHGQGPRTMRPEMAGKVGMIGAGRHYSVSAGVRIIEQGGNAVDAGVAAVFAASVAEISHFGFGGESPVIIYDAKRREVVVINGQGPAPKAATVEMFKEKGEIDGNGPRAATVPAMLDATSIALARYGTMSLGQVMQPAIDLAEGFPMYEYLRHYLESERKACEGFEWTMKTYYPEGRLPENGEMFRQANLARTLKEIAGAEKTEWTRSGDRVRAIRAARDLFYKGGIGKRIVDAALAAGGILTTEDLAAYEGRVEKPVTTTFHGFEVNKCGPWDQGPVLLQALNILEGFDLAEMGHLSTEYIHTVTEAIKLAYDDRDAFYGDPDFVRVPMRGLLSKAYAAERRVLIERKAAFLEHRPGNPWKYENVGASRTYPPIPSIRVGSGGSAGLASSRAAPRFAMPSSPSDEPGDTTCVNVVDRDGNLFSCTPSSGWLLGGAFIAGDTGVPLGNRMQAFSLDPASPNVLQGGKRPRTTLTPTIVLKDGKPFLALSTPGGDSQDQQILNVLLALIVFSKPLQEAIEAPRFNSQHIVSTFGKHADQPGVLEIEDRISPGVLDALTAKGHKLAVRGPFGISTGITAVGVDPKHGTLRGGADVRRERYVFGW
ncbi:MAG: gamma-glutamyltransferase family protein [Acidobacteria bacterium]|nr:gamma-glutamyltransferase family protein [Acidobacteriota bacterium]